MRLLLVEGEPVAAPARVRVEQVAHAPEHLGRLDDLGRLARDERAHAHQLVRLAHAEARLGRPARHVEIAQPALAVLHVGLEQVHRPAEAPVPLRHLALQPAEEEAQLRVGEERLLAAAPQRLREPAIPRHVPPVEQAGRRRQVVPGGVDELVHGDHLVPDGHPHVPQRIEQRVRHRRLPARRRRADAHVEVALERHRAAPVAPHARERDPLPRLRRHVARRIRGRGCRSSHAAEERGQQVVEDARVASAERDAARLQRHVVALGGDAVEELGAAPRERGAEVLEGSGRTGGREGGHRCRGESTFFPGPVLSSALQNRRSPVDAELRVTVCRLVAGLVVSDDDFSPEEEAFIERMLRPLRHRRSRGHLPHRRPQRGRRQRARPPPGRAGRGVRRPPRGGRRRRQDRRRGAGVPARGGRRRWASSAAVVEERVEKALGAKG